jgi:hypothetical protein
MQMGQYCVVASVEKVAILTVELAGKGCPRDDMRVYLI